MSCEEAKINMHDYVDEQLDEFTKNDVENHIQNCKTCFNEYKRLMLLFDRLKELPHVIEPPMEIVESLTAELLKQSAREEKDELLIPQKNIKKIKKEQVKQEKMLKTMRGADRKSIVTKKIVKPLLAPLRIDFKFDKTLLILLPLLLIAAAYLVYDFQKYNSPWTIRDIEGQHSIIGNPNSGKKWRQGESLMTDIKTKSIVHVPETCNIEVGVNSLVILEKAKDEANRIRLNKGTIKIINITEMPFFSIVVANSVIHDRGGEFIVTVDDKGNSKVQVNAAFVEIVHNGDSYFVDEGYLCNISNEFRPGTPYRFDASVEFKLAVEQFDYGSGGDEAVSKIISLAREIDMLTLLAMIPRVSQLQRQILFQGISNYFPPSESVTRMGIIKLNKEMLYKWWEEIEWQI